MSNLKGSGIQIVPRNNPDRPDAYPKIFLDSADLRSLTEAAVVLRRMQVAVRKAGALNAGHPFHDDLREAVGRLQYGILDFVEDHPS